MFAGDIDSAVAADLRAIDTLGDALAGTGKPLVTTSGTMLLAFAGLENAATEADVIEAGPRIDADNTVVALTERGIRSSVVRLAPTVHSTFDHNGFIPTLISIARSKGVAAYVGDGDNRWPAVHTLDAARLALESAPAGSRLHAVDDQGISFREIAEAIGRGLNVPVVSIPVTQADAHFGFLSAHATGRQPRLEHADPGPPQLEARPARSHRRPRPRPLLRRPGDHHTLSPLQPHPPSSRTASRRLESPTGPRDHPLGSANCIELDQLRQSPMDRSRFGGHRSVACKFAEDA
ncbi:hypothetical protein IU479_32465 [Nocardia abscessus]|uniref:hypothetical protein n=1 Tax=Nocardia abscessus TaxID=120957 RepID=UPI001893ABE7|nr:hypothetical protein [Nocardia abscessus]MBF6222801.1 hypothetical protein [Nocardia abscessus]